MSLHQKKSFFGAPLAGVCLAIVVSVPLSACLASFCGDTYNMRVTVYGGLLLWIVIGAVSVFFLSQNSQRCALNFRWFFLWFISTWLWPIPVLMALRSRLRSTH